MPQANDVIGTILGEAGGKTRPERIRDMVAVASAIHNRAKSLGVSPHDVVAAPGQFSAFGKELPPGTEDLRNIAQAAWDHVETYGPTHNGSYYATPTAVDNLPTGLAPVGATSSHQYYNDPKMRSIATVQGYRTPQPVDFTPVTAATQQSMQSVPATGDYGSPTLSGLNRTGLSRAANSMATSLGFDVQQGAMPSVGINSDYRTPEENRRQGGAKNSQHLAGNALDIDITGLTDQQKTDVLDRAIAAGARGIGVYGSGNTIHADVRPNPAAWGPARNPYAGVTSVASYPGWAQPAIGNLLSTPPGAVVTPRTGIAPTPEPRPSISPAPTAPQIAGPTDMFSVPAELASPQAAQAAMAAMAAPAPSAPSTSLTAPSAPAAALAQAAAQTPTATPAAAPTAPVGMAEAYSQLGRTMTQAGIANLAGKQLAPAPSLVSQAVAPAPMAPAVSLATPPTQTAAISAPVSALSLTPPAPRSVAAPAPVSARTAQVAAPARPSISAPAATRAAISSAPNAAGAVTAMGMGSIGRPSSTTVDRLGNTLSYSPAEDRTSITSRAGEVMGSVKGDIARGASAPSGTSSASRGKAQGSSIGAGLQASPGFGSLGTLGIGRETLGSFGGSMIGGLIGGPIGGLLGGMLGKAAIMGRFGALGGLGGFPSAPSNPGGFNSGGGRRSNRSESGMRDISPAASDAIGAGKGGLY